MLQGKTAVITGGVRGIGKCIAKTFCENGANVIVCYVNNDTAAEDTRKELEQYGTIVKMVKGDVKDPQTAKNVAELIKNDFGKKVDILVNNAGITKDKLMIKMDVEDFSNVIDVNLNGAFYMLKEVGTLMLKQRSGAIINMSSIAGVKGNPGQLNYSASKAGILGMTLSAAKEFGRRGVRVNAIAPGFIDTDMTSVLTEEQKKNAISNVSLQRMGETQDIANTALFLASNLSGYITGQTICVDGGIVM